MSSKLLTTTALALLVAAPAVAGGVEVPAPRAPIVLAGTDWTGGYAGANATVGTTGGTTFYGAGVHAGYLYDFGDYVVGGELSYNYLFNPSGNHIVAADAIFGYDGGNVMPFLSAGATYVTPGNNFGVSAGAGVKYQATDNLMLSAQYRYSYFPGPAQGMHQGVVGISYSF